MDFRTEIKIKKSTSCISHQSQILMMGSCFTTSIGQRMIDNKFNINLNPFGALYNPTSIKKGIELLLENRIFTEDDIFLDRGIYNSFYHHSSFSSIDRNECLQNINTSLQQASKQLQGADILFVTFGTAYVYEYLKTGEVVGNCHKLPTSAFKRYKLTVETIVKEWATLIEQLRELNPNLQIIFTVSPIRHLRDGAHDNQLSKATLLLAIEELNAQFCNTQYFPSYEIVLDDLRDYRFYDRDMIHPNSLAIDYIWTIFKEAYLAKESDTIIAEWNKIKQAIDHRPLNETSDEYIHFLKQTLLKLDIFSSKYQYILLNSERNALQNKINKLTRYI